MKLEDYLKERGISITEFSRRIDTTTHTVYNIIKKKREPKLKTAIKIVTLSGGKVDYVDLTI